MTGGSSRRVSWFCFLIFNFLDSYPSGIRLRVHFLTSQQKEPGFHFFCESVLSKSIWSQGGKQQTQTFSLKEFTRSSNSVSVQSFLDRLHFIYIPFHSQQLRCSEETLFAGTIQFSLVIVNSWIPVNHTIPEGNSTHGTEMPSFTEGESDPKKAMRFFTGHMENW